MKYNGKIIVMMLTAYISFVLLASIPVQKDEGKVKGDITTEKETYENATIVKVGIYVVSFGGYDFNKGTYTIDFYIWFLWNESTSPANFTPACFEFMNGRATTKEKISDGYENGTGLRSLWYRVQASLYTEPQFKDYPFGSQDLFIIVEDSKNSVENLVYQAIVPESGIDEELRISGWKIKGTTITISEKEYKWGEKYSRVTFVMNLERETTTTAVKTLLPPIIFCVVSGLSFFFKYDKIANRVGFGTSMLISAVMFHVSQVSSLPPLGNLIMIDKIMIATYSFLAASLISTTLIYIDEEYWKDKDYTTQTNRYGAMVSIILPFIVFGILSYF